MNWKRQFILVLLAVGACSGRAALIFTENMGTPTDITFISSYAGWENNGTLTFAGTGDVRTTSESGSYSGASGGGNVFLTTGGTIYLQIGSISTVGYKDLVLSFGAYKSAIASSMSELALQYSVNGTAWENLTIPAQPTGSGTAVWRMISGISLPTAAESYSDLNLRWINTASSSVQFRLDDIMLSGTPVPEPKHLGLMAGAGLLALCGFQFFRQRRASSTVSAGTIQLNDHFE